MTCIVGIVDEGNVLIGADSLSSNNHRKQVVRNPKIIRLSRPTAKSHPTDILLGYTSSWRMGQLLRGVRLPKMATDDAFDFLSTAFVDTVRQVLKDGGWATQKDGQEIGGSFLIGFDGHVFEMQSDYSILESADGYSATGSGEDWAMGSLHATGTIPSLTAERRVRLALEAASTFNPNVAPPFHVSSLADRPLRAVA